jgi:enoyl-CoA hydratase
VTPYGTISVDRTRAGVLMARLDRPERLNALSLEMFDDLVALQRDVDADPAIRVLVLTGTGRAFCAGLDLDVAAELNALPGTVMLEKQEHWARAVTGFATMDTPVVAAVNGAAAGAGMGIALACDVRIAAASTRFNAAFVRIGLSGGDVGTSYLLPRLVGLGRATEILLTGRFVDADEALRIGLVTDVVDDGDLLDRACETATLIAGNSPVGMRLTKRVVATNVDAPSLGAALEVENRNQVLAANTDDMPEALAAFREKRAPEFVGH